MKSKTLPEGELISSFLGYTVVGLFLVYTPRWALAFAVAFALTGASARVLIRMMPMAWLEASAGFVPVGWIGAWAFLVTMAESGLGLVAGAFAGIVAWFVFWAVARRVAFSFAGTRLGSIPVVVVFAMTGAVSWFVFGAVAGRVAMAVTEGGFVDVAVVVAWAWAWAWTWFVFEALVGVVAGSVAWVAAGVLLGVVFGIKVGVVVWAWAFTGVVAGSVSGAVSEAGNELLQSFCKLHTFLILALTSLSGLCLGWLSGRAFFPLINF